MFPCAGKCGAQVEGFEYINGEKHPPEGEEAYCAACRGHRRLDRQKSEYLKSSGITERERQLTFKSFRVTRENRPAFDAAKASANGSKNLYLFGNAGAGKTHLALGIVNERIDLGMASRFGTTARLLLDIRRQIQQTSEADVLDDLLKTPVLVLDDFGTQKITEWSLGFMDTLIDEWYRHGRTGLIVTSNFGLKELGKEISDRIASRLAGMAQIIRVAGDDGRLSG